MKAEFVDVGRAYSRFYIVNRLNSAVRGNYPVMMSQLNHDLAKLTRTFKPKWVICAGVLPVTAGTLDVVRECGAKSCIFLTDDPFTPARKATWLIHALRKYDCVFTPRRANLQALLEIGSKDVHYLPFAYAPDIHFREMDGADGEDDCDIAFVGGADRDRVPFATALLKAGMRVVLYGGYWDRYHATRSVARGIADPATIRKVTRRAPICLCLVRRSNRDGHCMRSFEVPAMGGCMLTEDTAEHRDIFGEEMQAVAYFQNADDMVKKARTLLDLPSVRLRLAESAHRLIQGGSNTYLDRLLSMVHAH
jgi:spore maturation protein CgeB